MSDFPKAQKIAALVLITLVVVVTLVVVAGQRAESESAEAEAQIAANATPTAVPVLAKQRLSWSSISTTMRGAQGTRPPVNCPFIDERVREPNNFLSLTPGLTFVCDQPGLQATPIAPGRVVMVVTQPALNSFKADLVANGNDGPWIRAAAYGPFVVIDHGPLGDVSNVTSVYAALDEVHPDLALGQFVDINSPLGSLGLRTINDEPVPGVLTFELLTDDTRFGADPMRQSPARRARALGWRRLSPTGSSYRSRPARCRLATLILVLGRHVTTGRAFTTGSISTAAPMTM